MILFENIQIQTISWCNIKCNHCPNSIIERPKKSMKIEIYKKILNELKELNFSGRFSPYLMNEPLLDPRLPDLVRLAKNKLPKAKIYVNTNGTLITKDKLLELNEVGIDYLYIKCYFNKKQYDRVKNLVVLLSLKNSKIEVIPEYLTKSKKEYYNRGGNIYLEKQNNNNKIEHTKLTCERPFIQMYINYLGKAILCCSDYRFEVVLGDISKETLIDIWKNEKYMKYRKFLKECNRIKLGLCKNCDYIPGTGITNI